MSDFEPVVPHLADFSPVEPLDGFPPQPVTPPIIEVARLNGFSQYWQLSSPIVIPEGSDFEMEISASRVSTVWGNLISGTNFRVSARGATGAYSLRVDIDEGGLRGAHTADNTWPSDNQTRKAVVSRVGSIISVQLDDIDGITTTNYEGPIQVVKLGRDAVIGGNDYLKGYAINLRVRINNTLTNSIPLTNKSQGATQLPTVGNVSATMVNYSEDVWEEV